MSSPDMSPKISSSSLATSSTASSSTATSSTASSNTSAPDASSSSMSPSNVNTSLAIRLHHPVPYPTNNPSHVPIKWVTPLPVWRINQHDLLEKQHHVYNIAARYNHCYYPRAMSPTMHALLFCLRVGALEVLEADVYTAQHVCDTAAAFISIVLGPLNTLMDGSDDLSSDGTPPQSTVTPIAPNLATTAACVLSGQTEDVESVAVMAKPVPLSTAAEELLHYFVIPRLLFDGKFALSFWKMLYVAGMTGGPLPSLPLGRDLRAHWAAGRLGLRPVSATTAAPYCVYFAVHWMRTAPTSSERIERCNQPSAASIADMFGPAPDAAADAWQFGASYAQAPEGKLCRVELPTAEDVKRMVSMLCVRWTATVVACLAGVTGRD